MKIISAESIGGKEESSYCCCAAKSICTSGGARAGDSTKWRVGSLNYKSSHQHQIPFTKFAY